MSKFKLRQLYRFAPYFSLGGTGLLALALFFPITFGGANAQSGGGEVRASANVQSMLSVAIDDAIDVNLMPSAAGSFESASGHLTVSTNNATGYNVYVNSRETNALQNANSKITAEISALSGARLPANFASNTWGLSVSSQPASADTVYQPVTAGLAQTTPIYAPRTSGGKEDLYLNLGAKVDTNLPSGQYNNTVIVSVIANPAEVTNLSHLVYMQDMTSSICAQTGTVTPGNEISKRLIDIRDNKQYWVAKLADGNCWMTQNLALDLKAGDTLTPATSDVSANWTVPTSTSFEVPRETPVDDTTATDDDNSEFWKYGSWNLGEYVSVFPDKFDTCLNDNPPVEGSSEAGAGYSIRFGQTFAQCPNFQDVSGGSWQPTFAAGNGTWNGESTYVAAQKDGAGGTYDAHYLIGNYYQFNAATAGTGGKDVVSPESAGTDPNALVNATDSICPRGWELAKAGRNLSDNQPFDLADSVYRLLRAYGYPAVGGYAIQPGSNQSFTTNETYSHSYRNIAHAPIHFVRNGTLSVQSGSVRFVGFNGSVWASTTPTPSTHFRSNGAYAFDMQRQTIFPTLSRNRYFGLSVRCLAK